MERINFDTLAVLEIFNPTIGLLKEFGNNFYENLNDAAESYRNKARREIDQNLDKIR